MAHDRKRQRAVVGGRAFPGRGIDDDRSGRHPHGKRMDAGLNAAGPRWKIVGDDQDLRHSDKRFGAAARGKPDQQMDEAVN